MTRMRDDGSEGPDGAAIELLREVSATPPEPEMKRRVWTALARTDPRPAVPLFRRLPMVASATAILLVAGTAGAVIARRFIGPMLHPAPTVAPVAEAVAAPPLRKAPARHMTEPPVVAPAQPTVDLGAVETAPTVRPSRGARRSAPADRTVRSVESAAPAPTPSPRERAEVLDAMIALRRDHDAARAGQLLDRYLASRPHGALREEALALAIEAADARADKASVSHWARTYQTDYPSGRFSTFARSHLATP